MKKISIILLMMYLLTSFDEPTDKWIVYLTEDDGTVHKCKREDYNEMMELLECDKKNNRLDESRFLTWEKDYHHLILHNPKRNINYGKLKEIKERKDTTKTVI